MLHHLAGRGGRGGDSGHPNFKNSYMVLPNLKFALQTKPGHQSHLGRRSFSLDVLKAFNQLDQILASVFPLNMSGEHLFILKNLNFPLNLLISHLET